MDTVAINRLLHIANLKEYPSGWTKELSIVSFNEETPKFDIRNWSADHDECSSANLQFSFDELRALTTLLSSYFKEGRHFESERVLESCNYDEEAEVKYNKCYYLGSIGSKFIGDDAWSLELNIMGWYVKFPPVNKLDIRYWSPDNKHMSRGMALFEDEARMLLNAAENYFKEVDAGTKESYDISTKK